MAMFFEVSDVKLEIDNRSKGYDDLNEWARNVATKEDLKAIEKVMKDAMLGVRTSLTNRMAFHGTFSMSMKHISRLRWKPLWVLTLQQKVFQ